MVEGVTALCFTYHLHESLENVHNLYGNGVYMPIINQRTNFGVLVVWVYVYFYKIKFYKTELRLHGSFSSLVTGRSSFV